MTDRVEELAARLRDLDGQPVSAHPEVLDEVHRGVVAELERLAGVVAGGGRGAHGSDADQR